MHALIQEKADKADLTALHELKSNKMDTENTMKGIEVLHKQLQHLNVLFVEIIKLNTNKLGDSKQSKVNKELFVLQQAQTVCQWVLNFDPYNVCQQDF